MNSNSVPLVREVIPRRGRLTETLGLAAHTGREKGTDSTMGMHKPYEPCQPLRVIRSSREARRLAEIERRREMILAVLGLALLLAAYGLAGSIDYHDRAMDLSGHVTASNWE